MGGHPQSMMGSGPHMCGPGMVMMPQMIPTPNATNVLGGQHLMGAHNVIGARNVMGGQVLAGHNMGMPGMMHGMAPMHLLQAQHFMPGCAPTNSDQRDKVEAANDLLSLVQGH